MLELGRHLHGVLAVTLTIVMLLTAGFAVLSWRLSRGPLDITWLARRIEQAVNPPGDAIRLTVASAALAWEGWRLGLDHPIDIRLTGITAERPDRAPIATIPAAEVSLSLRWLLLGRLVPRAIGFEGARLRVVRDADGAMSLDLGGSPDPATAPAASGAGRVETNPFVALLAQLGGPAATDRARAAAGWRWSQLVRVRIRDAEVVVIDRQLGATWHAPHGDIDLRRRPAGGIDGTAEVTLALGDQSTRVSAEGSVPPGGDGATVHARFTPLAPASLAAVAPALAVLKAVDAPVQGALDLALGPSFTLRQTALRVTMGAGTVLIAQGTVPVATATLDLATDGRTLTLSRLHAELVGPDGGRGPVLEGHGEAHRLDQGSVNLLDAPAAVAATASLTLAVDQVGLADLARYWPRGIARDPRAWVTANVTGGTARAAHFEVGLALSANQDLTLTGATGQVTADDVTMAWLKPVPPMELPHVVMTVISPNELMIAAQAGHQSGSQLLLSHAGMRITGLLEDRQVGAIDVTVAGPVTDALILLRLPRLHLLSRHPIDLPDPSGQVNTRLTVNLPLEDRVTIDQIAIHAQGQITALHLGHIAAGRDLDQATLDLDVNNDGLKLGGPAVLAGIPATLGVQMDFRAGPPSQVLQRLSVSGTATAGQLAAAGLDAGGYLSGSAVLQGSLVERRDGSGTGTVHAELQQAVLTVAPLGWQKPVGADASGDVRVALNHDRIVGVERLSLDAAGAAVAGRVDYADGRPAVLRLDRLVLGATQAAGELRFPATDGDPVRFSATGSALDLSARFGRRAAKTATRDDRPGRPWAGRLQFGQVILGPQRVLHDVAVQADNDGRVLRHAAVEGRAGTDDHFRVTIAPAGPQAADGRQLTAQASDAGALLRDLDLVSSMQGGVFTVTGRYDDSRADHPLSGTAEMDEFRLGDAPVAARVLKAMTLYGLADVLRGPGLGFERLVVPFRLTDEALDLDDARAFSASLGFTAKGHVDLDQRVADLQGTVVPAYFFNTLLGRVPLVGRLFSPETGGGVFAATYSVKGPLDDPAVTVNPLAALTPGFLRGVFGVFQK